jgi:hypothetical protein
MLTTDQELTAMFPHGGFERLFLVVRQRSSDGRFFGRAVAQTDTGYLEAKGSGFRVPRPPELVVTSRLRLHHESPLNELPDKLLRLMHVAA